MRKRNIYIYLLCVSVFFFFSFFFLLVFFLLFLMLAASFASEFCYCSDQLICGRTACWRMVPSIVSMDRQTDGLRVDEWQSGRHPKFPLRYPHVILPLIYSPAAPSRRGLYICLLPGERAELYSYIIAVPTPLISLCCRGIRL